MSQRHIPLGNAVAVFFQHPGCFIIFSFLGVITGEEAVIEIKVLADDEGRIGVIQDVVLEVLLLRQDIVDHPSQEGDIRPGT